MTAVTRFNTMLLLTWKFFEAAKAKPTPDPIYFCDSDATVPNTFDFQKSSLSDKSKEILDGLSDTIFEVLYFDTPEKAKANIAGTNLPEDYEVNTPSSQTIYARVHNKLAPNTCSEITSFTLTVSGLPVASDPGPYRACDTDVSGPNFGYHDEFLLNTKDEAILGGPDGLILYNISYHTTALGARTPDVSTIIPKDIPYRNVDINNQEIFVRLENKADDKCFDASMSFLLIVDTLPNVSNASIEQCIVDGELSSTINLTTAEKYISSTDNIIFEYFDNGGFPISDPDSYSVTPNTEETVYVKVISVLNPSCVSSLVELDLIIAETLNEDFEELVKIECDDFKDINGPSSNFILNQDAIISAIGSDTANDVFFYESIEDRNNEEGKLDLTNYRNDPTNIKFISVADGVKFPIYYKIKNSILNTCIGLGKFYLQINKVPSFFVIGEENIDDPRIVCLNNTPLILEAENPGAIYDYQWTNEVGDDLGNNVTLGVVAAGKYTVTATDKLPSGCSRSRTIVVKESNIATLEESFITIIDEATNIGNTDNISVSIDIISNNLGPGEYQFAITNEDTGKRYPFSGFQDEPIFENLEGGIYTITVSDKNGCAIDTELQISVIQFPKFFTPNGDGKNDVWSVKGANKIFYPNSSIDIFNRFGKLVAQIPIDSQGWDGTYNGTKLSSDDYWFRVQLIPANTSKIPVNKKGHFSLLRR